MHDIFFNQGDVSCDVLFACFLLCVYSHQASKVEAPDLCQRSNGLLIEAEGGLDFQFICWQGGVVYFIAGILYNLFNKN